MLLGHKVPNQVGGGAVTLFAMTNVGVKNRSENSDRVARRSKILPIHNWPLVVIMMPGLQADLVATRLSQLGVNVICHGVSFIKRGTRW